MGQLGHTTLPLAFYLFGGFLRGLTGVGKMAETSFQNKCEILADLWLNYRDEDEWKDFFDYNDLGLPLAYMISNGIVEQAPIGVNFILEAWDLMLSAVGAPDGEYDELDQILGREDSVDYDKPIGAPDMSEDEDDDEDEWEDPESDYVNVEDEPSYSDGYNDGYQIGYAAGFQEEQERIQAVVKMNKRWAKEKNRASEYMFWGNVGEVLTPIEINYSEEAYRKSLEDDGF